MNKTKSWLKTAIAALTILLITAVAFGISGAWYTSVKRVTGTINLNEGIVIDYSGFGQGSGTWSNNSATFSLFSTDGGLLPGATVSFNETSIKANSSSVDFFARVKLSYKFFTDVEGENEVTSQIADYSAFISAPTFTDAWVDGNNNGWFYYATDTTFNVFPKSYVNILASGSTLQLNGDAAGFFHEGGGYQYDEFTLIKRIEVVLTLEAYQANQTAAANAGWEIYVPEVVENSNSQVVEILQNQITLGNVGGAYKLGTGEAGTLSYDTTTLGTTLKIVVAGDSQINANAFENSGLEEIYIGDQDYINGVSSYAAKVYSSPATFIIGANAFKGCTNLKLYLSSGVNYTIYTNAIPSGATVYYNGSTISLPSSAGAVAGTGITMETPNIVNSSGFGGGAVAISQNLSKGAYTYEDAQGIWYFDLGDFAEGPLPDGYGYCPYVWQTDNESGSFAKITLFESYDNVILESVTVPSTLTSDEIVGVKTVKEVSISGKHFRTVILPETMVVLHHVSAATEESSLESVIFSGSALKYIKEHAFSNALVTSITLPNSVEYMESFVFQDCANLADVNIPTSMTYIPDAMFEGCVSLTSIKIPNSVTNIRRLAFKGSGLTSINIPNSVEEIGELAFEDSGLTGTITIPSSVTSWGFNSGVFHGCNITSFVSNSPYVSVLDNGRGLVVENKLVDVALQGLTSFTVPNTITSLSDGLFAGCSLSTITLPSGLTDIPDSLFKGARNLSSINIPNTVETIGASAFANCNITSITIPNSVWVIGGSAFEGCNLTSVVIPASVTRIKRYAFYNTPLQSVTFEGSGRIGNLELVSFAFAENSNLSTVNFNNWPSGVYVTVGDEAFANCKEGLVVNAPTAPQE